MTNLTAEQEQYIELAKMAYIGVAGQAKWESLTDKQKHDVVMTLIKDTARAFERIGEEIANVL